MPDERIRAMRRRLARRTQLVRARSRAKNEVHAVLMRCLKGRPPASDLFGVKGRRWLQEQVLPIPERETVDAAMRQVEFLDSEIAAVEALIAAEALVLARGQAADDGAGRQRDRRGDVDGRDRRRPPLPRPAQADRLPRSRSARPSIGCRAREPRPHLQAGLGERPSRAGRGELVDGAPAGPDRRLYVRIKARRGHSIAIVASARKLACLFWCLLTRGEDYAFAQPSLTNKKMRRLELAAGAPGLQGGRGVWNTNQAMRQAERELALQAQRAYQRTVKDRQQNKGASATAGRASSGPSKEQVARQTTRP
ncbi:MAG TPA: hypothetical protein VFB51_10825 [Solirubrobacterales bacterium]|nr:hypothetical protein [Solirubrobacterales bacterium]